MFLFILELNYLTLNSSDKAYPQAFLHWHSLSWLYCLKLSARCLYSPVVSRDVLHLYWELVSWY